MTVKMPSIVDKKVASVYPRAEIHSETADVRLPSHARDCGVIQSGVIVCFVQVGKTIWGDFEK